MSKFFLVPAAIAALLICVIASNLQAAHRVEVRLHSLTRYLNRYSGPPQRFNPYVVTVVANLRTGEVNSGVTTTFSNLRLGETRVNPTSDGLVSMTVENQSELYVLNILMDQMNEQRREHGRLRDWVHRSVQFTLQARSQDWSSGRIPTSTLIREITDRVLAGIDLPADRRLGYSHDGFDSIMPQPGAVPIAGKRELMPLVFLDAPGGSYWHDWLAFVRKNLLATRMIAPEDLSLFKVTDSVDETVAEILQFYRVFHSMEYVHGRLVMRLQSALDEKRLADFGRAYADILNDGQFRQETAIVGESPKPELAGLTRLTFHFNRRSLGRLRELIDTINNGQASSH